MGMGLKKNKKGFTLVEVLAATIILALIASTILGGFGFSQRMVRANSSRDAHAAQVQEAADVIIALINDSQTFLEIETETGYKYVAGGFFDDTEDSIQFIPVVNHNGSPLTRITVALYFDTAGGRDSVELVCFAFPGDI